MIDKGRFEERGGCLVDIRFETVSDGKLCQVRCSRVPTVAVAAGSMGMYVKKKLCGWWW